MSVDASDLVQQVETEAARIRSDAADLVLASCVDDCPVGVNDATHSHAGTLRASLAIEDTTDDSPIFSAVIGSAENYAQYTDETNAGAHPIPHGPQPITFWWDDGPAGPAIYTFFNGVTHPGTTGQQWFASKQPARWLDALASVV